MPGTKTSLKGRGVESTKLVVLSNGHSTGPDLCCDSLEITKKFAIWRVPVKRFELVSRAHFVTANVGGHRHAASAAQRQPAAVCPCGPTG